MMGPNALMASPTTTHKLHTARACPLLWRLYLAFELRHKCYARAKKVRT